MLVKDVSMQTVYQGEIAVKDRQISVPELNPASNPHLAYNSNNPSFLEQFEERDYVLSWSEGNQLKKVDMPRYGLHFEIKEDQKLKLGAKAYCQEFPGFF